MTTDRLRLCQCGSPVYEDESMCLDCLVGWDAPIIREEKHDRKQAMAAALVSAFVENVIGSEKYLQCGHPVSCRATDAQENEFCRMCAQGMA